MDDDILAIYSLCDDLLKALHHHHEDPQCTMSDAEVMTTALLAARFFGGNHERARRLLASPRYVPHMLCRIRDARLYRHEGFRGYVQSKAALRALVDDPC